MAVKLSLPMYCSLDAKSIGLDPSWIKLTDNIDFYLIFELRGEWDKFIELSSQFPSGLKEYLTRIKDEGKKFKYFCVKPNSEESKNNIQNIRVFFFTRTLGEFTTFTKKELIVTEIDLLTSIEALIKGNFDLVKKYEVGENNKRDIFICTHHERDQCCGSFGVKIFQKVKRNDFNLEGNLPQSIRFWESSHMGGHRVGPTFMDMPSGRVWAYVDKDNIQDILFHRENHVNILINYRGTIGLDRYSQILDKEIFKIRGWDWLDVPKRSEIVSQTDDQTIVKIIYKSANESGNFSAIVINSGKLKVPATQCSKSTIMKKFEIINLKHTKY